MAAVLGDLLRYTDRQTFLGQQCLNVYFYRVVAIAGLADPYLEEIGQWITDNVITVVAALQSSEVSHTDLFCENLSNGTDIFTFDEGFPIAGAASGDALPPYASYGFQLQRESRVTRNGYKRFAGVTEANQDNGIYTGAGSAITDVEDALAADVVISVALVAEPVIVKRPFVVPVASYDYSSVGSALFKGIGTQNTRKYGRGI